MNGFLKKYWHLIALALILLLGGFLRFYRISEISNFSYDPARDAEVIRKIVQDHKFTLLGPPTSVSSQDVGYGTTYFGPIFYYILAPGLLFSQMDPVGLVSIVALLGTLSIILIYLVVSKLTQSKCAALIASFLYAISPGAVEYSRWIWNPNLIPFFTLLMVYLLVIYQKNTKTLNLFCIGIIMGLLIQLHFMTYFLFLLPLALIALLKFYQKKDLSLFKSLSLLLLGFVIAISPMILFDLRHNFLNVKSVVYNLTTGKHANGDYFGLTLRHFWLVPEALLSKFLGLETFMSILLVLGLLLVGVAILLLKKHLRLSFFLLLVYFLGGWLGSSIYDHRGKLDPRYIIPFFPVLFLMFGVFSFLALRRKCLKYPFFILLMILSIFSFKADFELLTEGVYPIGLGFFRETSSLIINDVRQDKLIKRFNVTNLLEENDRRSNSFRYFFNAQRVPILGVEDYPNADILYVIDKDYGWEGIVNNTDTWEVYSFKPKILLKVLNGPDGVKIYKIGKEKNG